MISPNGRYIAFRYSADIHSGDVYLYDQTTRKLSLVTAGTDEQPGNAASGWPAVVTDGGLVLFDSLASNLVPGDYNATSITPSSYRDVFVYVP